MGEIDHEIHDELSYPLKRIKEQSLMIQYLAARIAFTIRAINQTYGIDDEIETESSDYWMQEARNQLKQVGFENMPFIIRDLNIMLKRK